MRLSLPRSWTPNAASSTIALHCEPLEERSLFAGDIVLEWNALLLEAIRVDRTAPPLAARQMAIMHVAMFDAVNSLAQTYEPYAFHHRILKGADASAAAAASAHRVLRELFPTQRAVFDVALASSLASIPDGPAEQKGIALGTIAAQHILGQRRHDGADQVVAYVLGNDPGDWQPTPPGFVFPPLLPQWPYVVPFTMESASQFRPEAPPALDSVAYAAAFAEVKDIGAVDSTLRSADQTAIARFWINGPGTSTPPGHWNRVAQIVAANEGLSLLENARLFALLNLALADAGIASWDAKYAYDFWRPVTAIRAAEADGNPATSADPDWLPLVTTPPFPAYTSGHSTFSAAAAAVLAELFGDEYAFTLESETPLAADRTFQRFSEAAWESGVSRIYGGIHWSFDNVAGLEAGRRLGEYVSEHFLQPRSEPPPHPFYDIRHLTDGMGRETGGVAWSLSLDASPASENALARRESPIADPPVDATWDDVPGTTWQVVADFRTPVLPDVVASDTPSLRRVALGTVAVNAIDGLELVADPDSPGNDAGPLAQR